MSNASGDCPSGSSFGCERSCAEKRNWLLLGPGAFASRRTDVDARKTTVSKGGTVSCRVATSCVRFLPGVRWWGEEGGGRRRERFVEQIPRRRYCSNVVFDSLGDALRHAMAMAARWLRHLCFLSVGECRDAAAGTADARGRGRNGSLFGVC
jgi:hypothetical protein